MTAALEDYLISFGETGSATDPSNHVIKATCSPGRVFNLLSIQLNINVCCKVRENIYKTPGKEEREHGNEICSIETELN